MNTWGPEKRSRAPKAGSKPAQRSSSTSRAKPAATAPSRARAGVRDATPPETRRRDVAQSELRQAVAGREHEFIGIVLIGLGVLLALAIYLDLAGPLGRGTETFVGWIVGVGRFGLPLVLFASGVALVKKGQSSSPVRLLIGWGLIGIAVLGLAHVFGDPKSLTDFGEVGDAGGFVGLAFGEPLQRLLAPAGAVVVLLAVGIAGGMLITQTSLRTMAFASP